MLTFIEIIVFIYKLLTQAQCGEVLGFPVHSTAEPHVAPQCKHQLSNRESNVHIIKS